MNKYDYYKDKDRIGKYFILLRSTDTAYAHRHNLTCLLTEIKKKYINQVEDRYRELTKTIENPGLPLDWTEDEKMHRKKGSYGPIALDLAQKGKLCITREKTYYDKSYMGDSDCEHIFKIDKSAEKFLQGQMQVIPTVYFVCGKNPYVRLPADWYGTLPSNRIPENLPH